MSVLEWGLIAVLLAFLFGIFFVLLNIPKKRCRWILRLKNGSYVDRWYENYPEKFIHKSQGGVDEEYELKKEYIAQKTVKKFGIIPVTFSLYENVQGSAAPIPAMYPRKTKAGDVEWEPWPEHREILVAMSANRAEAQHKLVRAGEQLPIFLMVVVLLLGVFGGLFGGIMIAPHLAHLGLLP